MRCADCICRRSGQRRRRLVCGGARRDCARHPLRMLVSPACLSSGFYPVFFIAAGALHRLVRFYHSRSCVTPLETCIWLSASPLGSSRCNSPVNEDNGICTSIPRGTAASAQLSSKPGLPANRPRATNASWVALCLFGPDGPAKLQPLCGL